MWEVRLGGSLKPAIVEDAFVDSSSCLPAEFVVGKEASAEGQLEPPPLWAVGTLPVNLSDLVVSG